LAVSQGFNYQDAARAAGRRSGDAVSALVARFNREGIKAVDPRRGGGHPSQYTPADAQRILREVRRIPTPEADGTATWSLTLLKKTLRTAPDGLPHVSTFTIHRVLHEAGYSFQRTRTWCHTGEAARRRKSGTVVVTDPDATSKKN
jgi:transposase